MGTDGDKWGSKGAGNHIYAAVYTTKNADNESLKMLGHTAGQAASEERVPGLVSIIFTRIDTIVKKNDYELMSLCVHFFEV